MVIVGSDLMISLAWEWMRDGDGGWGGTTGRVRLDGKSLFYSEGVVAIC